MNNESSQRSYSVKFSQVISCVEYKRILHRVESLLPLIKERKKEISLNISINKVNYVKEKFSLFGEESIKSFLKDNEEDIPSTSVIYDTRRQLEYLKFELLGYHVRYEEICRLPSQQFMKMRSVKKPKHLYYSLVKAVKYTCANSMTVSIESTKRATGSSVKSCQLLQQKEEFSLSLEVHLKQPLDVPLSPSSNPTFHQTWNLLYCSTKEYPLALETEEMKKSIIEKYNQLTQSRKEFIAFIGPSVVTFNFGNLKGGAIDIWDNKDKFSVTSKTDGLRYIGLFSFKKLILLGKGGDVVDFGIQMREDHLYDTIVDGEWVCDYATKRSHYLIFDLYFYKGRDVRYLDLKTRIDLIKEYNFENSFMTDENNIYVDVVIQVKRFLFPDEDSMCSAIKEVLEETKTMMYECDGIIFTRNVPLIGTNSWSLISQEEDESEASHIFLNTGKTWTSVVKWKPHTTLTVDFKIIFLPEEQVEFHTLLSSFDALDRDAVKNSYSSFGSNTSKTRISEKVKLTSRRCKNGDEITSGNIVEVLFVGEEEEVGKEEEEEKEKVGNEEEKKQTTVWEPQRIRSDKQVPNLESVARENYTLSRYPITEQDLLHERGYEMFGEGDPRKYDSVTLYKTENHEKSFIKPMTQLHMRLKRQFIEKIVYHQKKTCGGEKLRILDLACGRFGEIQIWTKGTIQESIELFLGIDYSENEISDLHGGANIRLLEQSRRCNHSFDHFLFLQGDCSQPFGSSGFTNCPKYTCIYESLFKGSLESNAKFPLFHDVFTVKKFHLCTMQFALHYFCSPEENHKDLHTLAENISSSLVNGGRFFGTCIDGCVMRRELDIGGDLFIQSPDGKVVLSVRRDARFPAGVFVFIESIGQEIFEFYVDFKVVDAIFEQHSLYATVCDDISDKEVHTHHGKIHVEDILTEETKKLPEVQPFLRFSCLHSMFVYEKRVE
jgi:hypothetical protein